MLDDGCRLLIAEKDDEIAGFVLYVASETDWERFASKGPHSKPAKLLAALRHPNILKSRLAKRRRIAKIFATEDGISGGEKISDKENAAWQSAEFFLGLIAVDPAHRGAGYGTSLLGACEQLAIGRQAKAVRIHMDPRNTQAQRVYARSGYSISGHDTRSLIMVKWLS